MAFPNFLVIGAPRAGTTSLHEYLGQHPDVFMSPRKEPRFFAYGPEGPDHSGPADSWTINQTDTTGLDTYEALFDGVEGESAVGEVTPTYLAESSSPKRIAEHAPDMRLIAVLRNPVERAFSDFVNMVRLRREPLDDFEEALDEEHRRIQEGWSPFYHYRRKGYYARHLGRYLEHFHPDQIRIFFFEDLVNDAQRVTRAIFKFLEVDPDVEVSTERTFNASGLPRSDTLQALLRSPPTRTALWVLPDIFDRLATRLEAVNLEKPDLSDDMFQSLAGEYVGDVRRLEGLLDVELDPWLDPGERHLEPTPADQDVAFVLSS